MEFGTADDVVVLGNPKTMPKAGHSYALVTGPCSRVNQLTIGSGCGNGRESAGRPVTRDFTRQSSAGSPFDNQTTDTFATATRLAAARSGTAGAAEPGGRSGVATGEAGRPAWGLGDFGGMGRKLDLVSAN